MSMGLRRGRLSRGAMVWAALVALSGCGLFESDEEILPGDRTPVRLASSLPTAPAERAAQLAPLGVAQALQDWPQSNASPNRAPGHLAGPAGGAAPREAWRVDVGTGASGDGRITSPPVVAGGRVFALDAASTVSAVDAASGRVVWRASLSPEGEGADDGFGGGLAVADGRVIATTGFGDVVALGVTDGAELWRRGLGAPLRAAPAVDDGRVVVVTRDNAGFALDARDGTVLWRVLGARGGAGFLGGASPALAGGLAVLPFLSGEVVAVAAANGRRIWADALASGQRGLASADISDITGDPIIAGSAVFVANQSGQMLALDARTGRRGWLRPIGSVTPAWAVGATLLAVSTEAQLVRLAAATGETLWAVDLPRWSDPEDREGAVAYGGPVVADGRVYLTSSEDGLLIFDAATGERVGGAPVSGGASAGPVIAGGALYVLSDDAVLYAFR